MVCAQGGLLQSTPRTTRKILVVALAAVAGCNKGSPSEVLSADPATVALSADSAKQAPASVPRPLEPTDARAPVAIMPAPLASARIPPDDPALLPLREELFQAGRAGALAHQDHFRPLCDADGYPLVGNVIRKVATPDYLPSQFCQEVRKPGPK
jgi:hypothetical protein